MPSRSPEILRKIVEDVNIRQIIHKAEENPGKTVIFGLPVSVLIFFATYTMTAALLGPPASPADASSQPLFSPTPAITTPPPYTPPPFHWTMPPEPTWAKAPVVTPDFPTQAAPTITATVPAPGKTTTTPVQATSPATTPGPTPDPDPTPDPTPDTTVTAPNPAVT